MAAPMTAAQTRVQMKKWLGARFKEYSGWTTRKRPGSFAPVGIVIHHTGSDSGQNSASYDEFLFKTGRPAEGIPGPLCDATCEMDGDVIVGAIGRANHAGSGSATTLAAVKADKVSLVSEIKPGADSINGNGWYYGLEVKFDGGQPMTTVQYDSAVRYAAAICDFYGWGAGSIVGHKEHTRRKDDPGHTNMAQFRRDVAARLKAGPGGTQSGDTGKPPVDEGDFTVAEADRVIAQLNNVSGHLADNARQNRLTETAELTKTFTDALAASEKRITEFVEARTQAYANFGAKHTDQVEATTAGDVDAALKDDFDALSAKYDELSAKFDELLAKVSGNGDVPKA
jgi:hypothetical protein